MSVSCSELDANKLWSHFTSWERCLKAVLLAWNRQKRSKIAVTISRSDSNRVNISMDLQDIEHLSDEVQKIMQKSKFSGDFSITDIKVTGFTCVCELPTEDYRIFTKLISTYLYFIRVMFDCDLILEMSIKAEEKSSRYDAIYELGFEGSVKFRLINNAVCQNFNSEEDFAVSRDKFLLKNLPARLSGFGDIEIALLPCSTPKERRPIFCGYDMPLFCLYCFDPFEFPIFKNERLPSASAALDNIQFGREYGLTMKGADWGITASALGLIQPYILKEVDFSNCKRYKPCNLILIAHFTLTQAPESLESKLKISHIFQSEIENIFKLNCEDIEVASKYAIEQALKLGRLDARKKAKEVSIANSVTSICEIVAQSTNNVFRETCLSLMNSVTTHGFKSDLESALHKCSGEKQKSKKRKLSDELEEQTRQETSNFNSSAFFSLRRLNAL